MVQESGLFEFEFLIALLLVGIGGAVLLQSLQTVKFTSKTFARNCGGSSDCKVICEASPKHPWLSICYNEQGTGSWTYIEGQ